MILNEQEKDRVIAFIKDEKKADAVKKFMLQHMLPQDDESKGWIFGIDENLSNEEYGERVKTIRNAIVLMEKAFNDMKLMAIDPPEEKKVRV